MKKIVYLLLVIMFTVNNNGFSQKAENIIDEVIWVVGDEAILRSDIESIIEDARIRRISLPENPFCTLPEQMAVEKLFLHQASIDSLQVQDDRIRAVVENDIKSYISDVGSVEKAEEIMKKSMSQLRSEMYDRYKKQELVRMMKDKLVKGIEATPVEVRHFYNKTNKDSFPTIPEQVEIQIISIKPPVPAEEVERIKSKLRGYGERAKKNPNDFAFLARLYSEDQASALKGGELGFVPRASYDQNFADVAYALQRPNQISRVVESQFGYHIIQLLERRGDKSNFRHILLRPKITNEAKKKGLHRLDSVADAIRKEKFSFENGVFRFSQDKETRMNSGLMMRQDRYTGSFVSHFEYKDLPREIATKAYSMKIGEVSDAFIMIDEKTGSPMLAIVKLKSKTPSHKANPRNDYQLLKTMLEQQKKADFLDKWIVKKQKDTFIKIDPKYVDCDFEHKGWIKK